MRDMHYAPFPYRRDKAPETHIQALRLRSDFPCSDTVCLPHPIQSQSQFPTKALEPNQITCCISTLQRSDLIVGDGDYLQKIREGIPQHDAKTAVYIQSLLAPQLISIRSILFHSSDCVRSLCYTLSRSGLPAGRFASPV